MKWITGAWKLIATASVCLFSFLVSYAKSIQPSPNPPTMISLENKAVTCGEIMTAVLSSFSSVHVETAISFYCLLLGLFYFLKGFNQLNIKYQLSCIV